MDCQAAREILDRASIAEDVSVDALAARAHANQCSACTELLDSRSRFDDQVAIAVNDVPLPEGLRERLLLAVTTASPAITLPPPKALRSRRRLAYRLAVSVCSLALAIGLWQYLEWRSRPQPFDLARLRTAAVELLQQAGGKIDLSALPKFDGSFDLASLTKWAKTADLRGVEIDGRRRRNDAAASVIQIGRGKDALGILLIVPIARVLDASVLAPQADVSYAPVAHAAWKSGEFVFVCVTTQNHLNDLMRMAPGRAGAA